jgi:hypothetical protein
MATKKEDSKNGNDTEKNVVHGKMEAKDVNEQARKARGEEDDSGDKVKAMRNYSDGRDKQAEKMLEEAFPERKAIDLRVESRQEFNEKFGIDPNKPDARFKVEKGEGFQGEKQYIGKLTLHSVHGETHEKLSFNCEIYNYPRGEEYLWYVMKNAHPHAIREEFTIDAENKTDPLLRSRFE